MRNKRILYFPVIAGLVFALGLVWKLGAAPSERYLHVQVWNVKKAAYDVNLNIPLSDAEKTLQSIDSGPLHQARLTLPDDQLAHVNVPDAVDAAQTVPDNQPETINQNGQRISVTKFNGNVVLVIGPFYVGNGRLPFVGMKGPSAVVKALFSTEHNNEVDLAAALRALRNDATFSLNVNNAEENASVSVDAQSQAH